MIEQNIKFNKNQKYIVFDTETEGLNLVYHRPFQLSWIVCDNFNVLETHNRYLYWDDLNISDGAKQITKFDYSFYKKNAEDPSVVYNDFAKYLFDKSIVNVCQNVFNFDCYMIKNLQKSLDLKVDFSYLNRSVDTKALFISLQKQILYNHKDNFMEWQYKVCNLHQKGLKSSQSFMLNYFGINYDKDKLHEALYDITMLYEIFKKLIAKISIPNL